MAPNPETRKRGRRRNRHQSPQQARVDKRQWRKVEPPEPWHPEEGDQLEAVYTGSVEKEGNDTKYTAHVFVEKGTDKPYYLSGTVICGCVASGAINLGETCLIVYNGMRPTNGGYEYKDYEVYTQF